jgi:queuine tRNA-ribosyltransferase
MLAPLRFAVEARDGAARAGTLELPHGRVLTPIFMPVGTQASVKGVLPRDLRELGAAIVLGNTYHLMLRPGPEVVARAGGLHGFMRWDRPILTDSGGFQAFSLAAGEGRAARRGEAKGGAAAFVGGIAALDDDGVAFRSHIDGSPVRLTPERSIEVQEALGADIIMPLDECPGNPCPREVARRAVERTIAWARRSLAAKRREDQALFGIQQGALFPDLRRECAARLAELDLPGYAVGGLAVGEEPQAMYDALAEAAPALPEAKPRYLMGVGTPPDLLEAIERGIDMFDCVMPTRNARNASVFTAEGRLNLRNARFREDLAPIEPGCDCATCAGGFARAYLRHLFVAEEMLAATLATIHNLRFYLRLVEGARAAIAGARFSAWKRGFLERYRAGAGEGEPAE